MLTHAENLDWSLMRNNISRADLDVVIEFLRQDDPILTQSKQVQAFEREWSDWMGVKYSVFLNSGSSANLATLTALRESGSEEVKRAYREKHPDLNPDFIFTFPAYNFRSTEINAAIGRSQLKRLDGNNRVRAENLKLFLEGLDPEHYRTDFAVEGSCNYAFTLILKRPDPELSQKMMDTLRRHCVEFRRGTAGGGNQPRQPYLRKLFLETDFENYPNVDHVHFYGVYLGNYPELEKANISKLCSILNRLPGTR